MARPQPRVVSLLVTLALGLIAPSLSASGDADVIREERQLSPFHSIRFDGHGELDVTVGREFSVIIETTNRAVPGIRTDVEGEELRIRRKRSTRRAPLRIEITMPVIDGLVLNGSARAKVHGPVNSAAFRVEIAGSGSAEIDELNVDSLDASLMGSGRIRAAGSADHALLDTSGSGDMELAKLATRIASVNITGSGAAELHVSDSLNGTITGSGEIRLDGSPDKMNVSTRGSGRIIQTSAAAASEAAPSAVASE